MYMGMNRATAFVVAWGVLAGLSSSLQALVWDPEVAVDALDGMYRADVAATTHAVHTIYGQEDADPIGLVQYRRSVDAGVTWANLHTFGSPASFWNIGIGADGDLVVATWTASVGGEHQVWAANSVDEGLTWSGEQALSSATTVETTTHHDVTVDGDRVAAFWIDLANGDRNYYCRLSLDRGVTWEPQSTVAVVPNVDDGAIDGVFSGDALVAVYYSAGSMLARRSTDFGQTWDGPIMVAADRPTGDQTRPRGLAASGSVVLACWWEGTGTVNVARSADAGLTWGWSGTPVMSTGIGYPSIAMRGAYALVAYQDSAIGVQWSESFDGGLTWGIPGAVGVWTAQSIPSALAFSSGYAHLMANRGAGGVYTARTSLPPPEMAVTPESLDFPSVELSSSAADTFAIVNTGPAALGVTGITSDDAAFAVSTTSVLPFDVLPQEPETVTVTFTPTVEGAQTANITITHSADGSPTVVTVTGTGTPVATPPTVVITAPTADEVLATGTTSIPLSVAITDHAAPGHWHWQRDTPFPDAGVAGGNHVDPDVLTDTIPNLVDEGMYTVYVALVDDSHAVLSPSVTAQVTFSVASTTVTGVDVTVPDSMGRPGGTVSITVEATSLAGLDVIGIALDVSYDATILTPANDGANTTAAVFGDVFPDVGQWAIEQNVPTPGLLTVGLAGNVDSAPNAAGVLVRVTFDVAADATAGATGLISLTKAEFNEGAATTVTDGTFRDYLNPRLRS